MFGAGGAAAVAGLIVASTPQAGATSIVLHPIIQGLINFILTIPL